jgi:hypothetical protein
MRIRLLVDRAMALGIQNAGDSLDVDDAEAIRMINAGQAEPVRDVAPERATPRKKAEKATKG